VLFRHVSSFNPLKPLTVNILFFFLHTLILVEYESGHFQVLLLKELNQKRRLVDEY